MASLYGSSAMETSTTTGTGTLSLAGAVAGYRTLVAAIGTGNTSRFRVEAVDADGAPTGEWEEFSGVVTDATPDTVTRAAVLASSTGSAIDFAAGTKRVYCVEPGAHKPFITLTTAADGDFLYRDSGVWVNKTTVQVGALVENALLPIDRAAAAGAGSGDLFAGTSLDGGWSSLQATALDSVDRSIAGYCMLKNTSNTAGASRGIQRAFAPAGDFFAYTKLASFNPIAANYVWGGLFVGAADPSDGGSGNRLEMQVYFDGTLMLFFRKMAAGSQTIVFATAIGGLSGLAAQQWMHWPVYLGIDRTGSTLTAYVSWDGVDWTVAGATTTIAFTVATVGLQVAQDTATTGVKAVFRYLVTEG